MTEKAGSGPEKSGRDNAGRFQPGNRIAVGHGRPRGGYGDLLRKAIPEARMTKIIDALGVAAEAGDPGAAKLVLGYLIGRPREQPQDANPWPLESLDLASASGCAKTAADIVQAAAAGHLDAEEAARALALVSKAAELSVVADLANRIEQLEAARV